MATPVLKIDNLTKRFGGLTAVDNLSLSLASGRLHAIIGPNGAGKTTLFNLISGFIPADSGRVELLGRDISGLQTYRINRLGMARTLQIKSVFNKMSVEDNLWIAVQARTGNFNPLRKAASFGATRDKVHALLEEIGLERHARRDAGTLSYGDIALLELGIALASEPRLLLLDEPICGMSPGETASTVNKIRELSAKVDIIIIEHDMEVVFDIAEDIIVMAQGAMLARGAPREISQNPLVREAYLGQPDEDDVSGLAAHA